VLDETGVPVASVDMVNKTMARDMTWGNDDLILGLKLEFFFWFGCHKQSKLVVLVVTSDWRLVEKLR
jgi:hypothetical protein